MLTTPSIWLIICYALNPTVPKMALQSMLSKTAPWWLLWQRRDAYEPATLLSISISTWETVTTFHSTTRVISKCWTRSSKVPPFSSYKSCKIKWQVSWHNSKINFDAERNVPSLCDSQHSEYYLVSSVSVVSTRYDYSQGGATTRRKFWSLCLGVRRLYSKIARKMRRGLEQWCDVICDHWHQSAAWVVSVIAYVEQCSMPSARGVCQIPTSCTKVTDDQQKCEWVSNGRSLLCSEIEQTDMAHGSIVKVSFQHNRAIVLLL